MADGLATVSDGIASVSDQDPTGVANLLAETVGQPQEGYTNDQEGLAGTVSNLSQGLAEGAEPTPLDPLVDPLAQTLGYSENEPAAQEGVISAAAANPRARNKGEVDGVAKGLTKAGNVLASDESPLSPLTAGILAPVVGTKEDNTGSPGVPGTLQDVAEGLTDLTNPNGAFAPLAPLTSGLAFVVAGGEDPTGGQLPEQLTGGLAGGVALLGEQVADNSGSAGPGEPLVETVGNLLGGERAEDDGGEPGEGEEPGEGGTTGTPLDVILDPIAEAIGGGAPSLPGLPGGGEGGIPETPLSPLTDALMENADPAVFAENLAGVIEDIGTNTPLEAVTEPLVEALRSGGLPDMGGGDDGEEPEEPNPAAGPIESAARQFVDAAPIEMIPTIGQPIEDGIITGAMTLDGLLAGGIPGAPALPGLPGGDEGEPGEGPTGTPLDAVLAPLADLAGGGLPEIPGLPGGDEGEPGEGPTGTPLDAVLAPLADLAGGGLPEIPGLPGGDTGGETPAPNPEAGPIESAAQQFVDVAPIEMIPTIGQPIEDGIITGAAALDGLLAGGIPGGDAGLPIPTDPSALTDLLGGTGSPLGSLPGADDLPTIPGLPTA